MKKTALLMLLILVSSLTQAEWSHTENIDLITDADTSLVVTSATAANGISGDPSLIIRCANNDFEVIIVWDEYVDNEDRMVVVDRFDSNDANGGVTWSASTNGRAAFAPDVYKRDLVEFFKSGTKYTVMTVDYNDTPMTAQFSLIGFSAQYAKLGCSI